MKKFYEKPEAEYLELMLQDVVMTGDLNFSVDIEEDDEEGRE